MTQQERPQVILQKTSRYTLATIAAAVAVCTVLTGCSSSAKENGDSTSATSGGQQTASTPSGKPIKIMAVGDFQSTILPYQFPETESLINILVKSTNADGGVNGRPIDVSLCDNNGDPNVASACARSAISQGDVAVLGSYSFDTNSMLPILQTASIPLVGNGATGSLDGSSPVSFPSDGGSVGYGLGMGNYAATHGCHTVGVLSVDEPIASIASDAIAAAMAAHGGKTVNVSVPAAGLPDYAAQVATMEREGADCFATNIGTSEIAKYLRDVRQSGSKGLFVSALTSFSPLVGKVDGLDQGVAVVASSYSLTDSAAPGVSALKALVAKYDPSLMSQLGVVSDTNAYIGYQVLLAGLRGISPTAPITAPSLLAELNGLQDVNTGFTPPLSFATRRSGIYSRIADTYQLTYLVDNGSLVRQGTWANVGTLLANLKN
jgi:branched-chain amino acid transport system substrate-binding protein